MFTARTTGRSSCCTLMKSVQRYYSGPPSKGDRVIIGMSGGVDSSVAARLLCDKDYDLSAVYMRNWDQRDETGTDSGCAWKEDWNDVQRVCKHLDIPCKLVDLSRQYWHRVFTPALRQWELGQTPNPDVWCNKEIKFGALFEHFASDKLIGPSSFLATGHYAQTERDPQTNRSKLLTGADPVKDQSYFLSAISEQSLSRTLFPVGHLTKPEVRQLAKDYDLPTAERPESMGLCFIGERGKFSKFIDQYLPPKPGPIMHQSTGKKLGTHQGLWEYTIGQRVGIPGLHQPVFASEKDYDTNTIYVVPTSSNEALYRQIIISRDFTWIWSESPPTGIYSKQGVAATAKFRHRMSPAPCTARVRAGKLEVAFDEPQLAIAPGQVLVLYQGDWCLGSGKISRAS